MELKEHRLRPLKFGENRWRRDFLAKIEEIDTGFDNWLERETWEEILNEEENK